jgi:hypothetical protein
MRYLFGFMCVLALGLMGCSETTGTGGSGGTGGYVCRPATGEPGSGGGGYYPPESPGVYSDEIEAMGEQGRVAVRFETSTDCTALVPSTECTIDSDNTEPVFFEIEFEGLDEQGESCSAGIAVTAEMVTEVPIQDAGTLNARFTIDITDDVGAKWFVDGEWAAPYGVEGQVRRTEGDTYCEATWFADDWCVF